MTTSHDIGDLLARAPVIPVIVIDDETVAVPLARALVAGGLTVLEVTLRTKCALASIKRIIAEEADVMPVQPLRRVGNPPVRDVLDLTEEAGEAEALVSPVAAETSRAQLEALSSVVVTANPAGSDTLEGLVREMLRPMLAEWLDAKLPAMVERLVAVEIERITARS